MNGLYVLPTNIAVAVNNNIKLTAIVKLYQ